MYYNKSTLELYHSVNVTYFSWSRCFCLQYLHAFNRIGVLLYSYTCFQFFPQFLFHGLYGKHVYEMYQLIQLTVQMGQVKHQVRFTRWRLVPTIVSDCVLIPFHTNLIKLLLNQLHEAKSCTLPTTEGRSSNTDSMRIYTVLLSWL